MARLLLAGAVAVGLVGSFAIAFVGQQRLLGGVFLVLVGIICAGFLWRRSGALATGVTGGAYALAFVLSHPLGDLIGPWPAVLVVAVAAGGVAFVMNRGRPGARIAQ